VTDPRSKPVQAKNRKRKRGPGRSAHRQAAEEAGIDRGLMYTCLRLAAIPKAEFEERLAAARAAGRPVRRSDVLDDAPAHQARRLLCCPHCGGELSKVEPVTITIEAEGGR